MVRELYAQEPEAELARFGLLATDLDVTTVDVWPDNLPALNVLIAMATQWRTGMAGPTGLDYAALPPVFRLLSIPRSLWPDTFECLRVMESEALKIMSEKK